MIRYLFLIAFLVSAPLFSQGISFNQVATHYTDPYTVTVYGNGTLYYTVDGSNPTLSSASAVNNFSVNINQNTTINVFLVDNQGNTSPTETKKYYTGQLPAAKIFFKPPATWASSCVSVDMVNPNSVNGSIVDGFFPMEDAGCQGWLKNENWRYENANLVFSTNCSFTSPLPGAEYTNLIPAGSIMVYDFTDGVISNPPPCLYLGTLELAKTVIVKIYPNPVENILHISSELKFERYIIYNSEGRIISEQKLNGENMDISFLGKGNYLLELFSKNKEKAIVKFIKN